MLFTDSPCTDPYKRYDRLLPKTADEKKVVSDRLCMLSTFSLGSHMRHTGTIIMSCSHR